MYHFLAPKFITVYSSKRCAKATRGVETSISTEKAFAYDENQRRYERAFFFLTFFSFYLCFFFTSPPGPLSTSSNFVTKAQLE